MRGALLWLVMMAVAWVPPGADGAAGIYRWQDAEGVVHFADRGSSDATRIDARGASMSVVQTVVVKDHAMRRLVEQEGDRLRRQRQSAIKAVEREQREREARCRGLARRLAAAESGSRRAPLRERAGLESEWYGACR